MWPSTPDHWINSQVKNQNKVGPQQPQQQLHFHEEPESDQPEACNDIANA